MTLRDSAGLNGRILVVDDERNIRRTLRMVLEGEGATVIEASTGEQAWTSLSEAAAADHPIEVVITDVLMPGMSGLELLQRLAESELSETAVPVILISGHATVDDAVRATRLGAFDFFEKPLARDRVVVSVRNALRQYAADAHARTLRTRIRGEIIGESEATTEMLKQIAKVGRTRARVLITGESGSGKELVARAIHEASDRREHVFVKVNCAAIPQDLIESELFGHEKGAFTGALALKKGLFEVANGGTIFLDEVGDMGASAQAKVLRVLQNGELMRVGGSKVIKVDVRVLAATHRDLAARVREQHFREDLFFRLNVVPLRVPPLRDRVRDIELLIRHFIDTSAAENGVATKRITTPALDSLQRYSWPGNVRELRNVAERMVVLADGDIDIDDLPDEVRGGTANAQRAAGSLLDSSELPANLSLRAFREAAERAFIQARLIEHAWNVSRTAESLGVERTHLHKKMKALGIQRSS